ncbi:MAG: hypothetical protein M3167_02865 [Acidobacteriota bacterium]|nr:hypothetical protein [Acidobacteriota bacterium]
MSRASGRERPVAWGVYRELAHSPGRETDDALILRVAAECLEAQGFRVLLKSSDEIVEAAASGAPPPASLFVMCERPEVLEALARWEERGVCQVNTTEAILNTYRNRTLVRFERAGIPFPRSVLADTSGERPRAPSGSADLSGLWIKRGDVHNTQPGDVRRAGSTQEALETLGALAARGVRRAVLQEHAEGDLVKFYGVGVLPAGSGLPAPLPWFEWFYHRDQELRRYPFDAGRLSEAAARAAAALELEVFGGDAIVGPDGRVVLIDLNAWPSFALYRQAAGLRIASHLAARFREHARTGVTE